MNTPTRFADAIEATEFLEQLQKMLHDPRLLQWCKSSDYTFCSNAENPLVDAQNAFAEVIRELDEAC